MTDQKAMRKVLDARWDMIRAEIVAIRETIETPQANPKHHIPSLVGISAMLETYIEQAENAAASVSEYIAEARDIVREINHVVEGLTEFHTAREEFGDHIDSKITNYKARLRQINYAMRDKEMRQLHGEELQISLRGLRIELRAFTKNVTQSGATPLQRERMRKLGVAVDVASACSELIQRDYQSSGEKKEL